MARKPSSGTRRVRNKLAKWLHRYVTTELQTTKDVREFVETIQDAICFRFDGRDATMQPLDAIVLQAKQAGAK